jgi:hypothetical protein
MSIHATIYRCLSGIGKLRMMVTMAWTLRATPSLRIPSACCPALRAYHQADSPDKICS